MKSVEPLHASCVAVEDRGVLILGSSGSGKSGLALALLADGAQLVGDDRIIIDERDGALIARPHPRLAGQIEARGVGILRLAHRAEATLLLAVDMDLEEMARLPILRQFCITDTCLPLIAGKCNPNLNHVVMACLKWGKAPLLLTPEG